jgi:hypothetical protein
MEKRTISYPCRESNRDFWADVQAAASWLYQQSHLGYYDAFSNWTIASNATLIDKLERTGKETLLV